MLCALDQFGSVVYAVNSPSPEIVRTRCSAPRTDLSKRDSSLSSSTSENPDTTVMGLPIMSSWKIGPSSRASATRFWIGAEALTSSMLPRIGFFGGFGIGSSASRESMSLKGSGRRPVRALELVELVRQQIGQMLHVGDHVCGRHQAEVQP